MVWANEAVSFFEFRAFLLVWTPVFVLEGMLVARTPLSMTIRLSWICRVISLADGLLTLAISLSRHDDFQIVQSA